jgi:hypothetical protein
VADFLYPVPADAPADGEQVTVQYGKAWQPLIIDKIDDLQNAALFDSPPADIEQQVQELIDQLMTPAIVSTSKRAEINHGNSIVLHGNPVDFIVNTAQQNNGNFRQETAAINDEWTNGFEAHAGSYILRFVCVRGTTSGILDFEVDSISGFSIDFYNATAQNRFVSDNGVYIPTDGYHVIHAKVNGKNASSTSYRIGIIAISLIPAIAD